MNRNGDPTTIPSKRFDIWRRLYARFTLEPAPASGSQAAVGVVVIPVTQVDRLLGVRAAQLVTEDLSPGAGAARGIYSCPVGVRATVLFVSGELTSSNTQLLARLLIAGATTDIALTAPGTAFRTYEGNPLTLDEGDSIIWLTTGNAGDSARVAGAIVVEEQSF